MGDQRSGSCCRHDSLPAVRIVKHRVSTDDAEIYDAGAGGAVVRVEDYSQGVLLPGLSFHVEQRGRTHYRPALASLLPRRRKSDLIAGVLWGTRSRRVLFW